MPELPRVSGAAIVRALERLGFEKAHQSGSHVIMRRGTKGCVVPLHSEVKVGTLAGVLRQAELSVEDFIRALEPWRLTRRSTGHAPAVVPLTERSRARRLTRR